MPLRRAIIPKKRRKPRKGGRQISHSDRVVHVPPALARVDIQTDSVTSEEDEAFVTELVEKKNIEIIEPEPDSCYDEKNLEPEEVVDVEMEKEYYVVVDFEATCFRGKKVPRQDREIIEFAAAMVDKHSLAVEDEFDAFVKPIVHPELHEYCIDLTSISQEDIDQAFTFPTVARQFRGWLEKFPGKKMFSSWGYYDKDQLEIDCQRHQVPFPFDESHINVKDLFSDIKGYKRKYGLSAALKRVKLTFEGTRHRGIDDVRNIVRVMRKILS